MFKRSSGGAPQEPPPFTINNSTCPNGTVRVSLEGELDIAYREDTQTFSYIQPERDGEPIELSPEPSWGRVAYRR